MNKIYKVLFIGSGNISPINIICKNLLDHGTVQYQFDGVNMYDNGYTEKNPYLYLTNLYRVDFGFKKDSWREVFFSLPLDRRNRLVLRILKASLLFRFNMAYGFFKSELKFWRFVTDIVKIAKNYDVVNIQYLHEWSAEIAPFIPNNIKVVISFWGSDLMATSGIDYYKLQFNALHRADLISIFSAESLEILLSKFGRDLLIKCHKVFYGLTTEQFKELVNNKQYFYELGKNLIFQQGFNPDEYEYIIKVGYSSFPGQNHMHILDEIDLLPRDIIEKSLFIFPMTYGDKENYIKLVEERILKSNIKAIVLSEYLSHDEAKSISFVCNIMLNLRSNDGFNNSMLESLIAGAIVLSGSWLPYSLLRQHDIYYCEVNSLQDLNRLLLKVLYDLKKHLENAEGNKRKLASLLNGANNAASWEKVLLH